MSDLRPIGTEFWGEPYQSKTMADCGLHRVLWKVIGHSRVYGNKTLEEVKLVRTQRQEWIGLDNLGQSIFDGTWKDE